MHRLSNDKDSNVRANAAKALGSAFSHVPDKHQVWDDLHRLSNDRDGNVRWSASYILGYAYFNIPNKDKQQAWSDLQRLTNDENQDVRVWSNHFFGKISIFKASQAQSEEDYKNELERAISFFENATESSYRERYPAQFCLPFYRSFYTIIFKKKEAQEEVDKYLAEAKEAVKDSMSKKLLIEAVENLANALNEVQNLEYMDLEAMKGELNFYRKYCERAAELMRDTEESTPYATEVLRKGLPILDRNLKGIIEEIQKKAKIISEQTKGTRFEELGEELHRSGLSLLQVRDLVGFRKQIQNLENKLSVMCSKLPEGQKGEACELLGTLREEHSIEDKIPLINDILSKFSYQLDVINCLNRIEARLDKLDCISFDIFRLKLNAGNVISNLDTMKTELRKLNETVSLNTFSIDQLNSSQTDKLNDLKNDISERLDEIEDLIESFPNNEDSQEVLDRLNKLKQSDLDILLQKSSGIATLISFFVMFAQVYLQYKPI